MARPLPPSTGARWPSCSTIESAASPPPADVPALAWAIDVASRLDRATCRRVAEERFAATTMAKRYERCFSGVVAGAAA